MNAMYDLLELVIKVLTAVVVVAITVALWALPIALIVYIAVLVLRATGVLAP